MGMGPVEGRQLDEVREPAEIGLFKINNFPVCDMRNTVVNGSSMVMLSSGTIRR